MGGSHRGLRLDLALFRETQQKSRCCSQKRPAKNTSQCMRAKSLTWWQKGTKERSHTKHSQKRTPALWTVMETRLNRSSLFVSWISDLSVLTWLGRFDLLPIKIAYH